MRLKPDFAASTKINFESYPLPTTSQSNKTTLNSAFNKQLKTRICFTRKMISTLRQITFARQTRISPNGKPKERHFGQFAHRSSNNLPMRIIGARNAAILFK
ncbi:MAG: hypothetical protein EBV69_01095 [Oxalobacteraceae bacterium]|nr:hypothetical protein [Oxalobacteraceae bacterium]